MASPVLEIVPAQYLTTSATTLYTSPAGTVTRIDKLSVVNVGVAAATVSIYLVPSGSSAGPSNLTTNGQSVLVGNTFNSPNEYGHYLNAGDALVALASTGSTLNILAGGTQVTG